MLDYKTTRLAIAKGLSKHLRCSVIRSNQNFEPPQMPYCAYTITTLMSQNNGTYGEYDDGTRRKPYRQIWSISVLSEDDEESVTLAMKAKNWFEVVGRTYLSDNDVIVQSVGGITNRDNVLSTGYQYRKGFDLSLYFMDLIEADDTEDVVETVIMQEERYDNASEEDLIERLEKRLDGETVPVVEDTTKLNTIEIHQDNLDDLLEQLEKRLDGVD